MKAISVVCLLVFFLLTGTNVYGARYDEYGVEITETDCDFKDGEIVPRQILVGLSEKLFSLPDGVDGASIGECEIDEALENIFLDYGAKNIRKTFIDFEIDDFKGDQGVPNLERFFAVYFTADLDVGRVCEELKELRGVLFAQPNRIIPRPGNDEEHSKASSFGDKAFPVDDPDDLDWGSQWNLEDTDRGIGCPSAWAISTGDSLVRIAVLESGISHSHYDLDIIDGRMFYMSDVGPVPIPVSAPLDTSLHRRHATQAAGVFAARTNNERGIAGIAGGNDDTPGCSLISLQLMAPWTEELIAYALYKGGDSTLDCDVISMSFGHECYSEPIRAAAAFCNSQKRNLVSGKGYTSTLPDSSFFIPQDLDYSWITAVGGYGADGLFCDLGDSCGIYSRIGWGVDILGPASIFPSTTTPGIGDTIFYNDYAIRGFSGTSGATPHVAGSLGLLRSVLGNGYNPIDYESILKLNSRDEQDHGSDGDPQTWHKRYGHGCLEIGAALEFVDDSDNEMLHFSALGSSNATLFPDTVSYTFMSGTYEGDYDVIPYKVSATISFGGQFSSKPIVWGEGGWPFPYTTAGLSAANPNYCKPFNGVVNSTVTSSGCTVFTYVFKVFDPDNEKFLGWYPNAPSNTPIGCIAYGATSKSSPKRTVEAHRAEIGPNPFNAKLNVSFELPVENLVAIDVFNVRGMMVRELTHGRFQAGDYMIPWDGRDDLGRVLPSGVYFVSLDLSGVRELRKVVMLK